LPRAARRWTRRERAPPSLRKPGIPTDSRGRTIDPDQQPSARAAATVGLNIPLPWGKEASEQQAAAAQLGAAQQRYEAALLDIQSALGEALARLKAAQNADALVVRKALPEARAVLKSIIADYAKGAAIRPLHSTHSTGPTTLNSSCSNYSWTNKRCSPRSND